MGLCFVEDSIGAVEIVVGIADLRGELNACDPHLAV